jgi:DNA-binding MarR family transcriptional regulator
MLWACARAPAGSRRQNELAEELAVSPAHVSGVVEGLRRRGLLECSMVEGDRRLRCWRLTPAGAAVWQTLINDFDQRGEAA